MSSQFSKIKRQQVYRKYNGRCAYCGCEISFQSMQIDHIHAKSSYRIDNLNELSNLNPSCRSCNNYKHFYSIDEFRMYLKQMLNEKHQYLFKSMVKYDLALKYGSIVVNPWDGLFYYERINHG